MGFYVGNVPVGIKYLKSALDAIGPIRFLKLNPWARELLEENRKPLRKQRKIEDSPHYEATIKLYTDLGLSRSDAIINMKIANKEGYPTPEEKHDSMETHSERTWIDDAYDSALYNLNHKYRFKPEKRQPLY